MSDGETKQPYPELPSLPNFPKIEECVLAYWESHHIFEESVRFRRPETEGGKEFVFYDGPPFANGLPHYGHLVTGYVKDLIPRYQTMRGYRVERRFGWDCHGLPAELAAEKELGISGRDRIREYGISRFNEFCRTSVLRYVSEWRQAVRRQARWVDFENDYKTMDLPYMESVIWAFKQLHTKGLIYEGVRVLPYSWAAETPVSNFETRLDDSYRARQDPALTVAFTPEGEGPTEERLLVWTTTPWTLPSNLALAVGPDIEYGVYRKGKVDYVLAVVAAANYSSELADAQLVRTVKGRELEGRKYRPLFPYFSQTPGAFRVLLASFVSVDEGTGIVHMAPGFGEEDLEVCRAAAIPIVCPVDERGRFTTEVSDYAGMNVFEANPVIIRYLKETGALIRHDTILHSYPHCWRTDEPLIYRAMSSWMVRVTELRDRMVILNRQIKWIPEHFRDGQFGKWLENARDWSISRMRFWGTPIPVWKSDDPNYPRLDVYGSLDELARDFGVHPSDLHRPYIDGLTRPNPDDPSGHSTMRRVPEVLDCWFESGAMPIAQIHYPFANNDWFERHFPADFIVEYVAQTRGWFYTLMVLGTALFDRPPFRNVICHGVVLDENNHKLSKRLQNYPSPEEVFDNIGADALRWFLISSPLMQGGNLSIDREGKEISKAGRQVLLPLWNAVHFFTLYANAEQIRAVHRTDSPNLLDRYILCKTRTAVQRLSERLEDFDVLGATQIIPSFLEVLNNWYIRRSRSRFWSTDPRLKERLAYDTLYTVLTTAIRSFAPFLPLISEDLYRALTGALSVHLTDWPDVSQFPEDPQLVDETDLVRDVCSAANSIREERRLRTRLPLPALIVGGPSAASLRSYRDVICDEVNVKDLILAPSAVEYAKPELHVLTPIAGKRLRSHLKEVLKSVEAGTWVLTPDGGVEVGSVSLLPGEFEIRQRVREGLTGITLPERKLVVLLDLTTTPQLEKEGRARDLVRAVQSARKDAGLHVSDRIALDCWTEDLELADAIEEYRTYIAGETLAIQMSVSRGDSGSAMTKVNIGGSLVSLSLRKISGND